MTIEDIIQGLKETYMICCSVFAYDRKKYIDGAIDRLNKYQMMQADYETRLKADKVAMLEEFDSQFDKICFYKNMGEWKTVPEIKAEYKAIIREKINELKGNQEGKNDET